MLLLLQKIPFLIELFFNGTYILIFSLKSSGKLPASWNITTVDAFLSIIAWLLPLTILFTVVTNYLVSHNLEDFFRKYSFSFITLLALFFSWGDEYLAFWLVSAHLVFSIISLYRIVPISEAINKPWFRLKLSPAQFVIVSFVVLISLGTSLLVLPIASTGESISLVDAFFMATSASCVTGLSTISVIQDLSLFGQVVILILIQVGGLGIMTLSSSVTLLLGKSMALSDRIIMQDLLNISTFEELLAMIVDIVKYTFIIELWGGIILTLAFSYQGLQLSEAIYYGFFHSISAFCNAGFSLFNNSLEGFATSPLIHGTISCLIILGGLGFIVLKELKKSFSHKMSFARFSLHTKIVLVTSSLLLVFGFFIVFFGEFLHSLDNYSLWEKIQISFFQSVTLRTAGFNTLPLPGIQPHIIYLMSLIMFIGACPGSTGGGIKTTTFAILIQSIKATLKGREKVELFDRTIPNQVVVRTTAITIISLIIISFFIFLLVRLEPTKGFLPLFFEAISAFGTVGLSLGVTPALSFAGKLAIVVLMFIGRVGALTLALAVGQRYESGGKFEFPEGHLMIG